MSGPDDGLRQWGEAHNSGLYRAQRLAREYPAAYEHVRNTPPDRPALFFCAVSARDPPPPNDRYMVVPFAAVELLDGLALHYQRSIQLVTYSTREFPHTHFLVVTRCVPPRRKRVFARNQRGEDLPEDDGGGARSYYAAADGE